MNERSVLHRINGKILALAAEIVDQLRLIHNSVKELFYLSVLNVNSIYSSCAVICSDIELALIDLSALNSVNRIGNGKGFDIFKSLKIEAMDFFDRLAV